MARKITNLEQMLDRFDRAADRGGGSFAGRGCKSDRQQIVRSLIAHGGSCSVLTAERNPWDGHNHGGVDTADRRPDDVPPRIPPVDALAAGTFDCADQILQGDRVAAAPCPLYRSPGAP